MITIKISRLLYFKPGNPTRSRQTSRYKIRKFHSITIHRISITAYSQWDEQRRDLLRRVEN